MKDKRTYTNAKEHGEDMSHENEVTIKNEDRGRLDLTFLIESHKKEIWKYQKEVSKLIHVQNELDNAKQVINELSANIVEQNRTIKILEKARNDLAEELKNK
tara:strand:- start:96 stop:401 length:306 start_codon:yes stop_codon:yes gene_type:complete